MLRRRTKGTTIPFGPTGRGIKTVVGTADQHLNTPLSIESPIATKQHTYGHLIKKLLLSTVTQFCPERKGQTGKVSTQNSQQAIRDKAKQLGRRYILSSLVGTGHGMVVNDFCYHIPCMKSSKAHGFLQVDQNAIAFDQLVV